MKYKDHTTTAQRLTGSRKAKTTPTPTQLTAILIIGVMILLAMSNDFNQLIN